MASESQEETSETQAKKYNLIQSNWMKNKHAKPQGNVTVDVVLEV